MTRLDTLHEDLKKKLKAGPADDELRQLILRAVEDLRPESEDCALTMNWKRVKCCAIVSEIADHLGLHALASTAVTHAERWFNRAPVDFFNLAPVDFATLTDPAVLFTRECLRAYVVHSFVVVYRGGDRDEAIKRIKRCLSLMEWLGDAKGHPMYGTRAQACRYLSEIYRTARQHTEARACLTQAFGFVQQRFQHHVNRPLGADARGAVAEGNKAEQQEMARVQRELESAFAEHRFALGFLASARIDYLEGALSRADEALIAVKALLIRWKDPITSATADLMQGIIARNRVADGESDTLERARELINGALGTFTDNGHVAKAMWARFELAVLLMHARRVGDARTEFDALDRETTLYFHTPGWLLLRARRLACYSYCRRSTLEGELCHNHGEALKWANRALALANDDEFPLGRGQIDALVTRASVHLADPAGTSVDEAERDLHAALKLNSPPRGFDARFVAVIQARLAQCRLRRDDLVGAETAFKRARRWAGTTEHASVLALLDEVRNEIATARNDLIFRLDDNLTYDEAIRRLRQFLVKRARQRHSSMAEAATQLGVGESTIYKWDKEDKAPPRTKRRARLAT